MASALSERQKERKREEKKCREDRGMQKCKVGTRDRKADIKAAAVFPFDRMFSCCVRYLHD